MSAECIQVLICSSLALGSARVDLVDVDGHTALHWAALGGNAEVCQMLMENGISPNVQVHNFLFDSDISVYRASQWCSG